MTTFAYDGRSNMTSAYVPVTETGSVLQSSTPEPKPMETTMPKQDMAIVAALVVVIIILVCLFLYLIVPPLVERIRRLTPVNKKRVNSRYETIEGWLITKRVRAHDDVCECKHNQTDREKTVHESSPDSHSCKEKVEPQSTNDDCDAMEAGTASPQQALHTAESYDTQETAESSFENDNECPICMSPFKAHEVVSWSPNDQCNHVYHHECIKEWLLRHSNCPFCRHIVLPVDDCVKQKMDRERYKELCQQRSQRLRQTYFCEQAGLVCFHDAVAVSGAGCDDKFAGQLNATRKALIRTVVRRTDLAKLRGSRKEEALENDSSGFVQCLAGDLSTLPNIGSADEDDVEEGLGDVDQATSADSSK